MNITKYEICIHFYSLKQTTSALEGAKNIANRCGIWNITLPRKFISPWSFMHVMAGSLQINTCMKPTLYIALQTKF